MQAKKDKYSGRKIVDSFLIEYQRDYQNIPLLKDDLYYIIDINIRDGRIIR